MDGRIATRLRRDEVWLVEGKLGWMIVGKDSGCRWQERVLVRVEVGCDGKSCSNFVDWKDGSSK